MVNIDICTYLHLYVLFEIQIKAKRNFVIYGEHCNMLGYVHFFIMLYEKQNHHWLSNICCVLMYARICTNIVYMVFKSKQTVRPFIWGKCRFLYNFASGFVIGIINSTQTVMLWHVVIIIIYTIVIQAL